MLSQNLTLPMPVYILLTVVAFAFSIFLIYLLICGIKKDRMRGLDIFDGNEILTPANMKSFIESRIVSGQKKLFYLARIDISDFENLQRSLGETQLSSLLKTISSDILKCSTGIKLTGGEEGSFIAFIKPAANFDAEKMCDILIKEVDKSYALTDDMKVDISSNAAIVSYPQGGETYSELISNLDMSVIVSKRKGSGNYTVYTDEISNAETQEYRIYTQIKEAIKERAFDARYQPIVNINNMEVMGGEALIRWQHPTLGALAPDKFLYILERTGDINWVGQWFLERVLRQEALWRSAYEQKFFIGLNLSSRQLLNPEFAESVVRIARKVKIDPSVIVFEISDIELYFTSEAAKNTIDILRRIGFKIAFDGYSADFSARLDKLPVNSIKINRDYWSKISESRIYENLLKMLVEYCASSDIALIACGVERRDEMEVLKANGIKYMQGYLFAKPCEAGEFISGVVLTPWSEELLKPEAAVSTVAQNDLKPENSPADDIPEVIVSENKTAENTSADFAKDIEIRKEAKDIDIITEIKATKENPPLHKKSKKNSVENANKG